MTSRRFCWLTMALVFLCVPKVVWGNGISITPTYVDVTLEEAREEKSFEIVLKNTTSQIETFELSVADFGSLNETGGIAFLTTDARKGEQKYGLASWMILEKSMVIVNPGEKQNILVTIDNKESLTAGGHYGAVLATVKPDNEQAGEIVGVNQSMACLVYVLKKGGERTDLKLNSLKFSKNWFNLPEKFLVRFQNGGNTHVIPRGKIEIYDFWGRLTGVGIINQESGKVLPESFRELITDVKYFNKWNIPGRYKIYVNYRYDGKDNFEKYENSVYYLGVEGVILIFLLIGILEYILMKRLVKKA